VIIWEFPEICWTRHFLLASTQPVDFHIAVIIGKPGAWTHCNFPWILHQYVVEQLLWRELMLPVLTVCSSVLLLTVFKHSSGHTLSCIKRHGWNTHCKNTIYVWYCVKSGCARKVKRRLWHKFKDFTVPNWKIIHIIIN
jgi:hypothetical protein